VRIRLTVGVGVLAALLGQPACRKSSRLTPPQSFHACESAACVIGALETAYQHRDLDTFATLLHPSFLFTANTDSGGLELDRAAWLRVHRRLFRPENAPPGEPPVPAEHWLTGVRIGFTPESDFEERRDLYRDPISNPNGLDPALWRVVGAHFAIEVGLDTQGQTDYVLESSADLAIADDSTKRRGESDKLLVYRWNDFGNWTWLLPWLDSAIPLDTTRITTWWEH
jgi:hypothetical protein